MFSGRFVVVLFVEEADPPDIHMVARNRVQPTETQPVVRHVQPLQLSGQRAHLGIPMNQCPAILEVDGTPQRSPVPSLHSRALGVEPRVEPGDIAALGMQFVFVNLS
jgi:hypothetical protein